MNILGKYTNYSGIWVPVDKLIRSCLMHYKKIAVVDGGFNLRQACGGTSRMQKERA